MTADPQLLVAEAEAQAAKARLFATLGEVQERLKPTTLAQDAVETAAQGVASAARKGADAVRTRPVAAAAIAGTIGLVFARGWIFDAIRRRRASDETATGENGLNSEGTRARTGAKKG